MAELNVWDFEEGVSRIVLSPDRPGTTPEKDTYLVRVESGDRDLFERRFSVHGWQMGHYYIYRLARAFQHSHNLLEARFSLQGGPVRDFDGRLQLWEGPGWLMVSLQGATSSIGRYEPRIVLDIFMEPDYKRYDYQKGLSPCLRLSGWTTPNDAVEFGLNLEHECKSAEQARKNLHITAPDDGLWDQAAMKQARSRNSSAKQPAEP